MYAGAFLYGLITTGLAEKAGHLGSIASAQVVSQLGARLNNKHQELKDKIF
jgi:sugar/nucleoside kinase (ribokinase family)